jgi:hypothetical protein
MATKKFEELNKTFNIASEPVSVEIEKVEDPAPIEKVDQSLIDLEKDYVYVRSTMTNIIDKGREALDNVLELAQETDSPRAYEVVGQLIDKMTTSTEKLLDLHKKMKEIKDGESNNSPTNVTNNAIFFGSTTEAIKMIKAQMKNADLEEDSDK